MLELLSPAGSEEAAIAAVQNGADAIYLGFGDFNARRNAKNFTEEQLEAAVRYCHVRGCKVYVTVNTLVSDRELTQAVALARTASAAGADALIIQDLGLARVLRQAVPDLPLHASTQMSIHNLAGVEAAAQMGMSRAVLARELSFEQIRFIAQNASIEVEVFIHGALCFCHSGQCYMSSLIGRHSGNRGVCAQPCRLDYSMGGRMDRYPLSLKDNCLIDHLAELESAGVACVKIEGRMKRPEYSAVVTRIYSRALREKSPPTPEEMRQLELAFSRQGFTDGYFTGKKGPEMFGIHADSDRDAQQLFAEARKGYSASETRRVPVDFFAVVNAGKPSRFAVQDKDGNRIAVDGPVPEPAVTTALTGQSVGEQLYKTGGTPYSCNEVNCLIDPGLYMPAAAINEIRRSLLAQLTERRKLPAERRSGAMPAPPTPAPGFDAPNMIFQIGAAEQMTPELAALKPDYLYVPLEILVSDYDKAELFREAGATLVAVLPRVITDTETAEAKKLLSRTAALGVTEALTGNLGHVFLAKALGLTARGDFGLNVFNSYTLGVLDQASLVSATLSFELRMSQARDFIKSMECELIVYGRMPSMITDQCIIKNSAGRCSCQTPGQLSDRKGSVFHVMPEFGCRNVIYNAHKLFLADRRADYESMGLWGVRLMFTTESPRECVQVARTYLGLSDYRPNNLTRGLYYRGVE